MKCGYTIVYWNGGMHWHRPYSREELAVTLRGYRRDGMRGWRFTYPRLSAYPGMTVKRKTFGWHIEREGMDNPVFIKRDDAPF